jgi:hypothetical protein
MANREINERGRGWLRFIWDKAATPDDWSSKGEPRPQCHIVALAKEENAVAASVGCALSRTRTGMPPEQMTCAIPGSRLGEVVERLEATVALDKVMANYAAQNAREFSR